MESGAAHPSVTSAAPGRSHEGSGLSHELHRAAQVTCAVVLHIRCLTVLFLFYIVGLSQKNRLVHDQRDDMSEEGYYYPSF